MTRSENLLRVGKIINCRSSAEGLLLYGPAAEVGVLDRASKDQTMPNNLDSYKKDLKKLEGEGELLHLAMQWECYPDKFKEAMGKNADQIIKALPKFSEVYQSWYSESKALVKLLLPDRLSDFGRHYEKPKPRKDITYESYRIEDYLQGLNVTLRREKVVGPEAAIPHFRQQQAILKAVSRRFESSLFDIKQLVQAELLDSEIVTAKELSKNGYMRAAGIVAGVVLESHLAQVCENHSIRLRKKAPGISEFNDALKKDDVIDLPNWRFIQHLSDIRNLCGHKKQTDPTREQVDDLISGVAKITKTLF